MSMYGRCAASGTKDIDLAKIKREKEKKYDP
jgi:hypothetical protein